MLFSTVRIATHNGFGTGFFFQFSFDKEKPIHTIVTNKHVVNFNTKERVNFSLHVKGDGLPSDENINVTLDTDWYFHPTQDLCFCVAGPLLNRIKTEKNKEIFFVSIGEDLIWDNTKLEGLNIMEDVVMVGYPSGLWDQKNNLPLFRRGVTSTHPAVDFNDKSKGAVDMACFPGSSGSPIFVLNENGYTDKKGTSYLGGKRIIFLGVLFQGPQFNAEGELIIKEIPTQQKVSAVTPMMINLGYYIKATEILSFKSEIEKLILKEK